MIGLIVHQKLSLQTSRLKVIIPTQQFLKEKVTAVNHVKIYVLVDNNEYNGFQAAWGVSYFVEANVSTFLFDVGPNADVLMFNAEELSVNISQAESIIISHEHGDHCGSLRRLNNF